MTEPNLRALAAFLPSLTDPAFRAGEFAGLETGENGAHEMPYAAYSKEANAFCDIAWAEGWVLHGHDWSMEAGNEGARLYQASAILEQATSDQLRLVISYILHRERYMEGALLSDFESGLTRRIVQRAADLVGQPNV